MRTFIIILALTISTSGFTPSRWELRRGGTLRRDNFRVSFPRQCEHEIRVGGGVGAGGTGVRGVSQRYIAAPTVRPSSSLTTTTTLKMYKGPQLPGGGGPKNNNDALVSSLVSVGLFGLFFFSPIGSFFFAAVNSLFLLAVSVPLALLVAFQLFNAIAVVKAPCPACGAEAAAIKGNDRISACLNCGATIRVTKDNKGLEVRGEG